MWMHRGFNGLKKHGYHYKEEWHALLVLTKKQVNHLNNA